MDKTHHKQLTSICKLCYVTQPKGPPQVDAQSRYVQSAQPRCPLHVLCYSGWARVIGNLCVISEESAHFTPHLPDLLRQVHSFESLCMVTLLTIAHGSNRAFCFSFESFFPMRTL